MEHLLELVVHMDNAVAASATDTFYAARTLYDELSQMERSRTPSKVRAGFAVALTDLKRMGTSIPGLDYPNMWAKGRPFVVAAIQGYGKDMPPAKSKAEEESVCYVHPSRIEELKVLSHVDYDATKLAGLCEELNTCSSGHAYHAVAMLVRAILDHVPPVFGMATFAEVANNFSGGRSFKASMQNLEKSSRNIADMHLHTQIGPKESLPNETQVNFRNDLDVLLQEIMKRLG